jgi:hypothetical protein
MFNLPLALLVCSALSTQFAGGNPFASPVIARDLAHQLRNASLQAFAAPDPERPGAFVAVLYVPEQLLVVEAYHPSPAVLEGRIRAHQYREAYLDLQGTPTPAGRFFVLDANANGLLTAVPGHGSVDVVDVAGRPSLLLNGDASEQKLGDGEYRARVTEADAEYARLLHVLISALEDRQSPTSSAG